MPEQLRSLFADVSTTTEAPNFSTVQVAIAALMVKAAAADDTFQDEERKAMESMLGDRFGLKPEHAVALIEESLEVLKGANGMYACSMVLNDELDDDQRKTLLAMIWEIMFADGTLHEYETRLMRRVGPILDIDDADNEAIRDRVRSQLRLDEA